MSVTNEVELDIISYPAQWKKEGRVPDISLEDFVLGQEQTKTIGSYRLDVPADNLVAVKAGADEFGEQKFFTLFDYEVPCENNASASLTDWSSQFSILRTRRSCRRILPRIRRLRLLRDSSTRSKHT